MKLAMLNCLKSNTVCIGAVCLRAFLQREKSFADYTEESVELVAFMRCNGCGKPVEKDAGMLEKMDRLKSIGVDVVHLGVCTKNNGVECDTITRIAQCLSQRGIKVVRGTH